MKLMKCLFPLLWWRDEVVVEVEVKEELNGDLSIAVLEPLSKLEVEEVEVKEKLVIELMLSPAEVEPAVERDEIVVDVEVKEELEDDVSIAVLEPLSKLEEEEVDVKEEMVFELKLCAAEVEAAVSDVEVNEELVEYLIQNL